MQSRQFRIKDNCQQKKLSEWMPEDVNRNDLQIIANVSVKDLTERDCDLLIFPTDLNQYGDEIGDHCIFNLLDNSVSTGNLMGFIGVNGTQINIHSRFTKDDDKDYFLHYMLSKVFCINLFNFKHSMSKESVFDFLLYLFPYYLKNAMQQGLFKQYQKKKHNDANVRGVINVNRHIRENIPFRGTISYDTREYSYDNDVTQLIRHTIEYIKHKPLGNAILQNDSDVKAYISQIVLATPTYSRNNRIKIVNANLRPLQHPYYTKYTNLQRLCLQILKHESIKYGNDKNKVYGILFDGAWLWEEYLATILKPKGFNHPENKRQKGGFNMFEKPSSDELFSKNSRRLYPDFYRDGFILDAKYKHLNNGVGREDLYQVVTYMYCEKASVGGYIYPSEQKASSTNHKLTGYGGTIHIIPFYVPQRIDPDKWSLELFKDEIGESEKNLTEYITSHN